MFLGEIDWLEKGHIWEILTWFQGFGKEENNLSVECSQKLIIAGINIFWSTSQLKSNSLLGSMQVFHVWMWVAGPPHFGPNWISIILEYTSVEVTGLVFFADIKPNFFMDFGEHISSFVSSESYRSYLHSIVTLKQ